MSTVTVPHVMLQEGKETPVLSTDGYNMPYYCEQKYPHDWLHSLQSLALNRCLQHPAHLISRNVLCSRDGEPFVLIGTPAKHNVPFDWTLIYLPDVFSISGVTSIYKLKCKIRKKLVSGCRVFRLNHKPFSNIGQ